MIYIDAIFASDRQHSPHERSLPWPETRGDLTVIVESKPHWASNMRAFRAESREYRAYADWTANGARQVLRPFRYPRR